MAFTQFTITSPPSAGSGGGITSYFVFKPFSLVPAGNIYNDWSLLYAAVSAVGGFRQIAFDGTDDTNMGQTDVIIPSGTYEMKNVELAGVTGEDGTTPSIFCSQGTVLKNATSFGAFITFGTNATSGAALIYDSGDVYHFFLGSASNLNGGNTAPLIQVTNGSALVVIASPASGINGSPYECMTMDSGASLILFGDISANFGSGAIRDDGSTSILAFVAVGSFLYSTTQPNYTGVVSITLADLASLHSYTNTSSGLTATTVQGAIDELATNRFAQYAAATNTTTGETILMSKAMPAGDLVNQYDGYFIRCGGSFAANVNAKRVRIYFGATVIADTGSVVLNNGRWQAEARVFRNAAATQVAVSFGWTTLAGLADFSSRTTPAETLSGAITIKVTGQATATADIQQDFLDIQKIEKK